MMKNARMVEKSGIFDLRYNINEIKNMNEKEFFDVLSKKIKLLKTKVNYDCDCGTNIEISC